MADFRIALIGAGMIAPAHITGAAAVPGIRLSAIADPSDAARKLADGAGVRWFTDHRTLLELARPDAVVVATPNALHVPVALDCIAAGVPVLVEKPIADTVEEAQRLCAAADAAGLPLLVGHHRRHNPIIRRAHQLVRDGALGRLVSINVLAAMLKPDAYFDTAWRRAPAGGGPVLINLIHEIDLLRFLYGEIITVEAITSSAVRGLPVEDTAAILLRFANGALGAITLSDAAVSPWSWDLASGENPAFFQPDVETHFLCGTEGALTLPRLNLWRYPGARGWNEPIAARSERPERGDPYGEQLRHLAAVVRGEEQPVISGIDGTRTLRATQAVHTAARTRRPVDLPPD
ncbi:MAG TPA: Gfo/Idh/MocA family oxidoreductase [Vineibacter sp.]|nr:Gfo/Idh/MocA family oxidoreductase [Vineibacter sp.]